MADRSGEPRWITSVVAHRVAAFYLIAFAIVIPSALLMALVTPAGAPTVGTYVFSTLGAAAPLLALAILEKVTRGEAVTLKRVFAQVRVRGPGLGWLAVAALTQPLVTLTASGVRVLLGTSPELQLIRPGMAEELGAWLVPAILIHFVAALATSPLLEEPGWRGFALSPLQARFGRLAGSLVVGVAWWAWHQPLNLALGLQPTWYDAVTMIAISFLIDAMFTLSGRNLLAAMLAHQAAGTTNTYLHQVPGDPVFLALLVGVVVVIRVFDHRRGV